jgi:deoxyribose-phosphate aldolase
VGVATAEQIRFLRRIAPAQVRIKASGGIKQAWQVRELLAAGADLVGTSAGVQIMREIQGEKATLPRPGIDY